MQLRARLAHDDFTARPHFQAEYEAILQESLPYKVTREDRLDPRAPTVAGKPLPTGLFSTSSFDYFFTRLARMC